MTSKDPNKSREIARPSDIFSRFRQEMDDFISGFSRGLPDSPFNQVFGGGGFAVDVSESDNSVDITAELPGLESSDIDVSVEGGSLTISAEKKNEEKSEGKNWHRVERSYGSFNRVIPLGFVPDADRLEASLEKGVLHITVPKPAQSEPTAKKIEVKAGK